MKRKTIMLTTPSGTYSTYEQAYREARALRAHISYITAQKEYSNFNVYIGVSEINSKLACYTCCSEKQVGRPKRKLIGDITNCFVKPHLHILIWNSEHADTISNLIINYLMKHHRSHINLEYELHINKKYILNSNEDETRVVDYISKQSKNVFSIEVNDNKETHNIYNDGLNEEKRKETMYTAPNNGTNQITNQTLINCNLQFMLIAIQQIIKQSEEALCDDLTFELLNMKQKILEIIQYGLNATNYDEIANITMRLEQLRKNAEYLYNKFLCHTEYTEQLISEIETFQNSCFDGGTQSHSSCLF